MKIKRVIEIEESDLERIREIVERENKTALSVTTRGTAYITIADSKLYDDCGDCISRSALQKSYHEECIGDCYVCKRYRVIKDSENKGISHCLLIDNAPTVFAYTEDDMCKATVDGYDVAKKQFERPQGEWVIVKDEKYGDNVKCPFCGKELAGTDLNFCCKCGAKMKGGAE